MTGWRLGYIACPKHFVAAFGKIQSQVWCIFYFLFVNYAQLNIKLLLISFSSKTSKQMLKFYHILQLRGKLLRKFPTFIWRVGLVLLFMLYATYNVRHILLGTGSEKIRKEFLLSSLKWYKIEWVPILLAY